MAQVLCPVIVGRDRELQSLDLALAAALRGNGTCALLVGEPGIGKSRLAREVGRWSAARHVPAVIGRAVPASATAPYRPITEALHQLLRGRAIPDDAGMAPWLPPLRPLLPALPVAGESVVDVPAAVRGEAVLQLLRRLAPNGLVMVLEDMHWADRDTVELIEYVVDNLMGERLLCVLTLRSSPLSPALETARRQRGRPTVVHLALDRLGAEDMAHMVRACNPAADLELLHRIQAAADGLPLLVEDLLASPGLPESFVETVRERLAEFGVDERAVIEVAAILGRDFEWELLPAASGQPATVVTETLGRAVDSLLMSTEGHPR